MRKVVQIRPSVSGHWHVVWCTHEGCAFVYVASVKVDATDQARYHRDAHKESKP